MVINSFAFANILLTLLEERFYICRVIYLTNSSKHSRPAPESWKLVRGARQLLTLRGRNAARRGHELSDLGMIVDGSVLMRNGIIDAVGPTRRIENMAGARNAQEIDAAGRVVMPAFVDPHACLVPVPGYRHETVKSVHALPANRLEAQADNLLKLLARHGTATVGALSGRGGDATGELKVLRTLNGRDRNPLDIVPILFFMTVRHDNAGAATDLLNTVSRRKLARIAAVQCGDGGFSGMEAESLLRAAQTAGLGIRLEMGASRELNLVETAVNLQALSITVPGQYRAPEIEVLSDSSTFAILLSPVIARTGLRSSARELIDHGALIALGSGLGPERGATASMQTVVQLACSHLGLSLAEAVSAASVNAAWALGLGAQMGSIEHGKAGDLVLLNASDYREIPLYAGTNLVHSTIKRGVVLFKEDFPGWPQSA
jgi:imidazolonepropionase